MFSLVARGLPYIEAAIRTLCCGLRGQSVRLLEMAQTFLTDAEVDELVTVYEDRLLAAFEGVLRAGMVIANVSLITLS